MKKTLSLLLSILLIFGVMAPITAFAENGPHPTTIDKIGTGNADFSTTQFSAIGLIDIETFDMCLIYPETEEMPVPDELKSLVNYDIETNTLSLNGLKLPTYGLALYCMGDDFKINLTGYNELMAINSSANNWGGSITLTGDGELVLNRELLDTTGLYIDANGDPSTFTVEENVLFKSYSNADEYYGEDALGVYIEGTTAETPFNIKGNVNEGKEGFEEYTHQFIEEYTVHDLFYTDTYYDIGLTKENDDTIYIGYEDEDGKYSVSSLEYDEALQLYLETPYKDGEPVSPAEEGFTVITEIPLYNEALGNYVGNPYDEYAPDKKFIHILDISFESKMKICVDENNVPYGYEEYEDIDYDTFEPITYYEVYQLIPHDKLGWIAKETNKEDLTGLTKVVLGEEQRKDCYYEGDLVINNGGALEEPGLVEDLKLENAPGYIKVSFSAVKDAEYYDIYSFDFNTEKWVYKDSFEATAKPSYKYTSVVANEEYILMVVARNKVGFSEIDDDYEGYAYIKYREPTKAVAYEVLSNGIKVKWYRHSEGSYYRVYRRRADESVWTKIADTKNANYTDTTAKYGVKYYYAVRTFFKDGTYSGVKSSTDITRVAKAKLVSATNEAKGGIKVTWGVTSGASGYKVYRKTGNSKWTLLKDIKDAKATTYTDTSAKKGTTYTYTVRAYNKNSTGTFEAGITVKCLGIPAVKLSNASNGVKISWGKVAGASKYRVYRKGPGETKWTTLKDTTSLSFTDTKASAGKKYTYTVKAISGKSISSCASKTILRLKNPTLKAASKTADGVKLTWGSVAGAESYYVYRKTANSGWTKITETSNKSYIDTTAKKGTTYIYTVRAVNGSTLSSYNSTGLKIKR